MKEYMYKLCQKFIGEVYLMVSVIFFGVAFVVMRYAMSYKLGPQSFNAGRFLVAALCLLVTKYYSVEFPVSRTSTESPVQLSVEPRGSILSLLLKPNTIMWGTILGVLNFIASGFLQGGLATVDANRAGFIVGMYVVFVPIAESCIPGLNSKLTPRAWVAAFMSLVGLYLMSGCAEVEVCMGGAFGIGEFYVLCSMAVWVVSIICSSIGSKIVDPITLTLMNFIVATFCSIVCGWVMEPEVWVFPFTAFTEEWVILWVVGIFQAAGFALCTIGQRYSSPTISALIMSQETVVCALASYFALNETLSAVEVAGCVIMLVATVVALVPMGAEDAVKSADKAASFDDTAELLGSFGTDGDDQEARVSPKSPRTLLNKQFGKV